MTGVDAPTERLITRCRAMGVALEAAPAGQMIALLDRMAVEPQNLSAIDPFEEGIERHLADSLAARCLDVVREAVDLIDLGSGGGFPGLALAMSSPECAVTLVESERRKADWLTRAARDLPNVRVVADRTEDLASREREAWSLATARALAGLPSLLELAAPLVAVGGSLVAWRGPRDRDEELRARRAADVLGWREGPVTPVSPFSGAERHLHEYRKVAPAPAKFPRRPGRATKRPLA